MDPPLGFSLVVSATTLTEPHCTGLWSHPRVPVLLLVQQPSPSLIAHSYGLTPGLQSFCEYCSLHIVVNPTLPGPWTPTLLVLQPSRYTVTDLPRNLVVSAVCDLCFYLILTCKSDPLKQAKPCDRAWYTDQGTNYRYTTVWRYRGTLEGLESCREVQGGPKGLCSCPDNMRLPKGNITVCVNHSASEGLLGCLQTQ